jgi:hypothetical protein
MLFYARNLGEITFASSCLPHCARGVGGSKKYYESWSSFPKNQELLLGQFEFSHTYYFVCEMFGNRNQINVQCSIYQFMDIMF